MNYQYWAKAANGKSVRGRKSAENEEELLEWIRDKGWVPINIVRTYETVARIGDSFGKNNGAPTSTTVPASTNNFVILPL